jgi:hypothetical protein
MNQPEQASKREKRSLELIAEFEGGYAVSWKFAVGEYFKDALDIKLTERKEGKVSRQVWTQGNASPSAWVTPFTIHPTPTGCHGERP